MRNADFFALHDFVGQIMEDLSAFLDDGQYVDFDIAVVKHSATGAIIVPYHANDSDKAKLQFSVEMKDKYRQAFKGSCAG